MKYKYITFNGRKHDEKCLYRPTEQVENGIVWERWIRGGNCEWIFGGRTLIDRSASKMDVIEKFIEIPEDFTERGGVR
jgi:hypothetical protein